MTNQQPSMSGPWKASFEELPRKKWSWMPFFLGIATGITVGIIGVFALGAVLFEDDIVADLEAARADDASHVTRAESVPRDAQEAILKLLPCNDQLCVQMNKVRLEDIGVSLVAVQPRQASIDLSHTYGEWHRALHIWDSQWCNQETNETCDEAAQDMNDAIHTMRYIVPVQ